VKDTASNFENVLQLTEICITQLFNDKILRNTYRNRTLIRRRFREILLKKAKTLQQRNGTIHSNVETFTRCGNEKKNVITLSISSKTAESNANQKPPENIEDGELPVDMTMLDIWVNIMNKKIF
jgi:hypothetical protein